MKASRLTQFFSMLTLSATLLTGVFSGTVFANQANYAPSATDYVSPTFQGVNVQQNATVGLVLNVLGNIIVSGVIRNGSANDANPVTIDDSLDVTGVVKNTKLNSERTGDADLPVHVDDKFQVKNLFGVADDFVMIKKPLANPTGSLDDIVSWIAPDNILTELNSESNTPVQIGDKLKVDGKSRFVLNEDLSSTGDKYVLRIGDNRFESGSTPGLAFGGATGGTFGDLNSIFNDALDVRVTRLVNTGEDTQNTALDFDRNEVSSSNSAFFINRDTGKNVQIGGMPTLLCIGAPSQDQAKVLTYVMSASFRSSFPEVNATTGCFSDVKGFLGFANVKLAFPTAFLTVAPTPGASGGLPSSLSVVGDVMSLASYALNGYFYSLSSKLLSSNRLWVSNEATGVTGTGLSPLAITGANPAQGMTFDTNHLDTWGDRTNGSAAAWTGLYLNAYSGRDVEVGAKNITNATYNKGSALIVNARRDGGLTDAGGNPSFQIRFYSDSGNAGSDYKMVFDPNEIGVMGGAGLSINARPGMSSSVVIGSSSKGTATDLVVHGDTIVQGDSNKSVVVTENSVTSYGAGNQLTLNPNRQPVVVGADLSVGNKLRLNRNAVYYSRLTVSILKSNADTDAFASCDTNDILLSCDYDYYGDTDYSLSDGINLGIVKPYAKEDLFVRESSTPTQGQTWFGLQTCRLTAKVKEDAAAQRYGGSSSGNVSTSSVPMRYTSSVTARCLDSAAQ